MKKSIIIAILISIAFLLFFWYLVASSFYDKSTAIQKEFITDGCTLFIEFTWKECCMKHDEQYWLGGNTQKRKNVDTEFKKCVYEKSNQKVVSQVMYGVVRVMGTPFVVTPWRWGYGWEFGRGYR
ncbi:MAG: FAD-binding oxidoreductase [Candidatus Moraniibacteriota bacterium]|jgi:hypothetical protein